MEGQGVTASASSAADRNGESGRSAVAAAEFDDPGVSRVAGEAVGDGEGQRSNEADTVVIPAIGQPEAPVPGAAVSPESPVRSEPPVPPEPPRSAELPRSG